MTPSTRAKIVTRRTYNRPLDETGTVFETWEQTVYRVIGHQRWLWERARGAVLQAEQELELAELEKLMIDRKVSVSGRTLWLGGTDVAKSREASQFNCSFSRASTVHDLVDHFWLLLQGCGVGAKPTPGILNGFAQPVSEIVVLRSNRTVAQWEAGEKGIERNIEHFYESEGKRVWALTVGDSAAAWAKALGKLMAMKKRVDRIILDFSQIRAPGIRLKGYGWISSGDETISIAFKAIAELLSKRAGQLLTLMDILDVENWMGTTLSSRRSAEILLADYGDPEWEQFARAKDKWWETGNAQRQQSNNSLIFWNRPSKAELYGIFSIMERAGGSEPGFVNGEAARRRGPWFVGFNPCAEIILGDRSFCNLVEVDLGKFNGNFAGLKRAVELASRANYRQTCVNLKDGVLQESWHELNEFLRLQGVGLTGIVKWEYVDEPTCFQFLRTVAHEGSYAMADELGLPRSKAITTVKPSGTLSKIMDTTEGVHKPLGKYIFNRVGFSKHDPIVPRVRAAGYLVEDHPTDPSAVLVCFPVAYDDVEFSRQTVSREGREVEVEVNTETAVEQLNRYKLLMENYVDHNCSITISYSTDEVPAIVDWLFENWDTYVGVSFIYRNDPTKTAKDLGYLYLPQTVVTKEDYDAYVATLSPVDLDGANSFDELDEQGCATGACPIR